MVEQEDCLIISSDCDLPFRGMVHACVHCGKYMAGPVNKYACESKGKTHTLPKLLQ
jgi:hypothetical protein